MGHALSAPESACCREAPSCRLRRAAPILKLPIPCAAEVALSTTTPENLVLAAAKESFLVVIKTMPGMLT
jgi:hypothetical protein